MMVWMISHKILLGLSANGLGGRSGRLRVPLIDLEAIHFVAVRPESRLVREERVDLFAEAKGVGRAVFLHVAGDIDDAVRHLFKPAIFIDWNFPFVKATPDADGRFQAVADFIEFRKAAEDVLRGAYRQVALKETDHHAVGSPGLLPGAEALEDAPKHFLVSLKCRG